MSRPKPPAIAAGHQHAEAFCRMLYRTEDGTQEEWIWNSRDGVTPFYIRNRDGTSEMRHVEWHRDQYLPDYTPQVGERMFVDASQFPDQIRTRVHDYVQRNWEPATEPGGDGAPLPPGIKSYGFESTDVATEHFAKHWMEPGQPTVVEITPDGPMLQRDPQ